VVGTGKAFHVVLNESRNSASRVPPVWDGPLRGTPHDVEPIPETQQAVDEFGPFTAQPDKDLIDVLRDHSTTVERLVPSLVGLSVASVAEGVTFTLVASGEVPAVLDGLQYLGDGPCLRAAEEATRVERSGDGLLAEDSWQLFALGAAEAGVGSTLTLPVMADDAVIGTVNLYASHPQAFDGHHEEIADVFGAWAPGAIRNADLSFATRHEARSAPTRLRESVLVLVATGIIARLQDVDTTTARARLAAAASLAGITPEALATTVVASTSDEPRRDDGPHAAG
jgi:GAF domain-containing protein